MSTLAVREPLSRQLAPEALPGVHKRVPLRALWLSLAAMVVAMVGAFSAPEILDGYDALSWLLALVPSFLLAYYRGWRGAVRTQALGVALVLVSEFVAEYVWGLDVDWILLFWTTSAILLVGLGLGVLSELLQRERSGALVLAYSDPLTGLPNRRLLHFILEKEFGAAERGRPLTVVLFDVDGFKSYNESFGHRVGDEALQRIAETIDRNTRRMNVSGRYGGDEFLSSLSGEKAAGSRVFAERTRRAIAAIPLSAGVSVRVSAGIATYDPSMRTPGDLLDAADQALSRAKAEGGDRCSVYESVTLPAAAGAASMAAHPAVAERTWARAALEEAEIRYRTLFSEVPIGLYRTSTEGRLLDGNRALARILGLRDREELIGQNVAKVYVDPGARARWQSEIERVGVVDNFEFRVRRPDGSVGWVRDRARAVRDADGRVLYYEGVLEDVTARKLAEEKVREANQRIITTLNSITDAFFSVDAEWRFTFLNDRAAEVLAQLGLHRDGVTGKSIWDLFPDGVGTHGQRELHRAMEQGIPVSFESFYAPLDIWFEVHAFPAQGGLSTYVRDITERKRAEEALRDSQRALSTLMSNLPGMAYRCKNDPQWTLEVTSDGARELTGYGPEALVGNRVISFGDLIHPDDRDRVWEEVQNALSRREAYRLSYRLRTADGEEKWVWEQGRGIFDSRGELEALEGFITDITERKRAEEALQRSEEQLRLSQRLEAVGQLAGGVAHDFNNLLTAILGHSGLLLSDLPVNDPMRSEIEEIKKAGERAASLTRQLLAFSRKQMLRPKILDLNVVVAELDRMLQRLIGEDIEFRSVLDPELGRVRADPGQIEQVIVNLAVNARDAMPEGGKLTIETANVELDAKYVQRRVVVQPGSYVMLAVSDTGTGMTPEVQAKIFEPFFTTKEVGKGTGLGLATVYGIVKQSEGYIWVYSEPGKGTTFKLYLPRVDAAAEPITPDIERRGLPRGSETVLVVEDEAVVRKLVREILEKHGYVVLEAADGEGALRVARGHSGPIHLVITDVVMPGMSGPELSEKLAGVQPNTKVLFTSGYTDHAIVDRGVLDPDADFLQKPFTPDSLARRVREALDGGRRGEDGSRAAPP